MNVLNLIAERKDWLLMLLLEHLELAGISCLIAGVIGLLLGIVMYQHRKTASVILAVTNVIYTIPSIAMFGFLIPFTGIGNKTAVIALTIYALMPMVKNTYSGLNSVDASIVEAALGMGSTKWQALTRVMLPMAVPVIMTGVRSMVVMTISVASIASYIGAGGLGSAIYRGLATNNTELIMAGSIAVALLALLSDWLLGLLDKKNGNKGDHTR